MRKLLSNSYFIHLCALLGLLSTFGYIMTSDKLLIFFIALSFSGAVCGSFILVIDTVNKGKV
jgi:hypothetical protein